MITNYTDFIYNFFEYSLQGYHLNIIGAGFFWAILFSVIGGYVYIKSQSMVAFAVVMLVFMAAFGNALVGVNPWHNFMLIVVALIMMGLVLVFITKNRRK